MCESGVDIPGLRRSVGVEHGGVAGGQPPRHCLSAHKHLPGAEGHNHFSTTALVAKQLL